MELDENECDEKREDLRRPGVERITFTNIVALDVRVVRPDLCRRPSPVYGQGAGGVVI